MRQFKIRSSASGQIMSEPKSKADKEAGLLGKTAQGYCQDWLKEQIYNRKKEFSSKYTQKGLIMEDNSIDFLSEYLKLGFVIKNEKYFENDFITGTPDLILANCVIDVKNSWDCFTFPLFDTDLPNVAYYYQLQCYMDLTGLKKAKLIYVLSNTPDNLIDKEAYYWCKNNGIDEVDNDIITEFYDKMTYNNIPDKHKIKVFEIEHNQDVIDKIYNQVLKCRNYINTIKI